MEQASTLFRAAARYCRRNGSGTHYDKPGRARRLPNHGNSRDQAVKIAKAIEMAKRKTG